MSYATGTINSGNPSRDFMAAVQPTLIAGGLQLVETYQTPTNNTWSATAFGAGLFVTAAANSATVVTSPDGVTWTSRSLPISANWTAIAYGGGQFVLIASSSSSYCTSPDGITWTLRTTFPVVGAIYAFTYGAGQFVALQNGSANVAVSTDGVNWQTRTNQAGAYNYYAATYANGLFVAVANGTTICATSPDAVTWTPRSLINSLAWVTVAYGGGVWVAMNSSGTGVYAYSVDGLTWQSKTIAVAAAIKAVTYANGMFVGVGAVANIYTSPDGLTWTPQPVTNGLCVSIAYGNSTFVAPQSPGYAADVSTNGTTWTVRTLPGTSITPTADVYKSPAASNAFGQDWYLILRRSSDTNTSVYYQVAEAYDSVNHLVSKYGGTGVSSLPTSASGWVNPAAAMAPDAASAFGSQAVFLITSSTAVPYYVSATADRVVVGVKTTNETGFYAGLYEDMLPAGTTGFPLGCAKLPSNSVVSSGSIGSGTVNSSGGFTREPGAPVASTGNLEAGIWNTWLFSVNAAASFINVGFGLMTDSNALYGNTNTLARVPIGSTRSATGNTADAIRGLLIGVLMSQVTSLQGDTITAGTKTYVRFGGPITTVGYFVDSAL